MSTGILGSIRWWFEVLTRGLGGFACDPSETKCSDQKHCVVCELFGCTGWSRKFRFDVLDAQGNIRYNQIKKNCKFEFRFIPLRPISEKELTLIDLSLRLISDFGAIGGKTVLKPSDEKNRESAAHHIDYGIIELQQSPQFQRVSRNELQNFIPKNQCNCGHDYAWASLDSFWFLGGRYLGRADSKNSTFNRVLGIVEDKRNSRYPGPYKWLAGGRGESKKVFSFKASARTFGFIKNGISFDDMFNSLNKVFPDLKKDEFLDGCQVLKQLFE